MREFPITQNLNHRYPNRTTGIADCFKNYTRHDRNRDAIADQGFCLRWDYIDR